MNVKTIIFAGIAGGILLLVLLIAINMIMNIVVPYDIMKFEGMRPADDPVLILFFLYPFVIAFSQAIVFDLVKSSLAGNQVQKGIQFSALSIVIMTIPSLYVMFTSMNWPIDFYISSLVWEIIGFLMIGTFYVRIWRI